MQSKKYGDLDMKIKRLIALILALCALFAFSSCGEEESSPYDGKIKIVFELEGGNYKNSPKSVVHYYDYDEDGVAILRLDEIDDKLAPVLRSGYELVGWYTEKTQNGEEVTYSGEWNFNSTTTENLTLYAKWEEDVKCTYTVCYVDEDGKIVPVTEKSVYTVKKGDKFKDRYDYAEKRDGYTFFEFLTEDGEPWDTSFVHPGKDAEGDSNVNVIASYLPVKGDFVIAYTANDITTANNKAKDVYLMNDIDMGGTELTFEYFNERKFYGNGYKLSNFKVVYNATTTALVKNPDLENATENDTLCISLFGNIENAIIDGATFSDFTVEIKNTYPGVKRIIFAPVAVIAKDSTIKGVTISGSVSYKISNLPVGFDLDNLTIVEDGVCYKENGENQISDNTVQITVINE